MLKKIFICITITAVLMGSTVFSASADEEVRGELADLAAELKFDEDEDDVVVYDEEDEDYEESDDREEDNEEDHEENDDYEDSEKDDDDDDVIPFRDEKDVPIQVEEDEDEDEEEPELEYLGNFTLTAYCPCAQCCGAANQPTASGTMPEEGRTVAMGGMDFGTELMINGEIYTVEDRGTDYGHVDIFMESHDACLQFGVQSADVYLVK